MSHFFLFSKKARANARGFSIVELVVVAAIFVIISTVFLVRNSDFNSKIGLSNLAHSIALTVREAQVYGTSVRGVDPSGGGSLSFSETYGIFFDSSNPTEYILYVPDSSDSQFPLYRTSGPNPSFVIETFTIGQGNEIADACSVNTGGATNCSTGTLHVAFTRPNPNALIHRNSHSTSFPEGRVIIEAKDGSQKTIHVMSNGQIYVQ